MFKAHLQNGAGRCPQCGEAVWNSFDCDAADRLLHSPGPRWRTFDPAVLMDCGAVSATSGTFCRLRAKLKANEALYDQPAETHAQVLCDDLQEFRTNHNWASNASSSSCPLALSRSTSLKDSKR